jgi:hypothetical protein
MIRLTFRGEGKSSVGVHRGIFPDFEPGLAGPRSLRVGSGGGGGHVGTQVL